ncbi:hypothetical protein QY049_25735 [Bradyrhizobium sp. WYCCWR 13022]|uniref:hypothetical protein n=1 Tax=unclassified Bradyrhizobium TaxID=2631580 RepID=UPI00263A7C47|nr:hypothetical protein [Bradyrhizobium sp. WYCCWR 13022]MDN4986565.1 hypothetical protein [Bradyrhizobium sp. WYCCWR 13022]
MDLQHQIPVNGLPIYLLLLISESDAGVADSAAAEVIHVRFSALVCHAMPAKEPVVPEPLPLDIQIVF